MVGDGTNRAAAAGYPRRYRAGTGNRIGAAFVGGFFAIAAAVLALAGTTLRPGESTAAIIVLVIGALLATVAGLVIYATLIARAVLTEDAILVRTHTGTARLRRTGTAGRRFIPTRRRPSVLLVPTQPGALGMRWYAVVPCSR